MRGSARFALAGILGASVVLATLVTVPSCEGSFDVSACAPGFATCPCIEGYEACVNGVSISESNSNSSFDGCGTNLNTDTNNCGQCGNRCYAQTQPDIPQSLCDTTGVSCSCVNGTCPFGGTNPLGEDGSGSGGGSGSGSGSGGGSTGPGACEIWDDGTVISCVAWTNLTASEASQLCNQGTAPNSDVPACSTANVLGTCVSPPSNGNSTTITFYAVGGQRCAVEEASCNGTFSCQEDDAGQDAAPAPDAASGCKVVSPHPGTAGSIYCGLDADGGAPLTCVTGQQCCLGGTIGGGVYAPQECASFGGDCTNGTNAEPIECAQLGDCTANGLAGVVCCLQGAASSPSIVPGCSYYKQSGGTAIRCEATASGACASGEVEICAAQSDCPSGKTCTPLDWKIFDLGFCM